MAGAGAGDDGSGPICIRQILYDEEFRRAARAPRSARFLARFGIAAGRAAAERIAAAGLQACRLSQTSLDTSSQT